MFPDLLSPRGLSLEGALETEVGVLVVRASQPRSVALPGKLWSPESEQGLSWRLAGQQQLPGIKSESVSGAVCSPVPCVARVHSRVLLVPTCQACAGTCEPAEAGRGAPASMTCKKHERRWLCRHFRFPRSLPQGCGGGAAAEILCAPFEGLRWARGHPVHKSQRFLFGRGGCCRCF